MVSKTWMAIGLVLAGYFAYSNGLHERFIVVNTTPAATDREGQQKLAKYDYESGVRAIQNSQKCINYLNRNSIWPFSDYRFCKDFVQLLPDHPQFDPEARKRWMDAAYNQYCRDGTSYEWCAPYRHLVHGNKTFNPKAREAWLKVNFKHACFGQTGSRAQYSGCSAAGVAYRTVQNWREKPQS